MVTDLRSEQAPLPKSAGEAMVAELRWVHDAIRHDLDKVRRMADDIAAGAPPEQVRAEIGRLRTNSPIWKLRANCLHYCRFVHHHHRLEDVALFPELRRTNPALGPVVDRLEEDHRVVGDYLDEIEAAVADLGRSDTPRGRRRVVDGLEGLSGHLLTHLAFEEVEISPTLLRWERWPGR